MRRTFWSCRPCCPGAISCRRSRSGSIISKRELKKRKSRADCARKPNLIQWGNASRSLFDLTVNRWRFGSFQVANGKHCVELISKLLGTEERAAVLGREKSNEPAGERGLAHTNTTRQNGVLFIQKRPPFQGESGTAGLPRAKAPDFAKPTSRLAFWRHLPQHEGRHSVSDGGLGYSVDHLRGEENSDGVAMLTRTTAAAETVSLTSVASNMLQIETAKIPRGN